MSKDQRFTFVCEKDERKLLEAIAERLERTQSDTIRYLVKLAAQELRLNLQDNLQSEGVNNG
jgi:hypothetical protein